MDSRLEWISEGKTLKDHKIWFFKCLPSYNTLRQPSGKGSAPPFPFLHFWGHFQTSPTPFQRFYLPLGAAVGHLGTRRQTEGKQSLIYN